MLSNGLTSLALPLLTSCIAVCTVWAIPEQAELGGEFVDIKV